MILTKIRLIIKKFALKLIKLVQVVLMFSLLTFIYFIGFGITFVMLAIFRRSLLKDASKNNASLWNEGKDYNPDFENSLRQS